MNDRAASTKTILIVEDDKLTAHVYSSLFQRAGYRVDNAFDGLTAISYLEQNQPDAVLLDIMLPGKNGIEVLRAFRSRASARNTPVTAVTNAFVPHFVAAAREAGATNVFSKASVTPMELTESFRGTSPNPTPSRTSSPAELSYVPFEAPVGRSPHCEV